MSNLKDLTWEHHQNAERQDFVKVILSGKIHPDFYATYLWNQHKKYDLLEAVAGVHGLLDDLYSIRRKNAIEDDFNELWTHSEPPVLVPSTWKYIDHIKTVIDNPEALMAHIYVLHMGDLSGGQLISRKIPGTGRMYKFDEDVKILKEKIREKTHNGMAEEARWVFSSATDLFQELMEIDCEHYLE